MAICGYDNVFKSCPQSYVIWYLKIRKINRYDKYIWVNQMFLFKRNTCDIEKSIICNTVNVFYFPPRNGQHIGEIG